MWREVERGRQQRTVHGLLAIDAAGAVAGWTFYILHGRTLQVGGLRAASADAARALVDGIFASDLAAAAGDIRSLRSRMRRRWMTCCRRVV